MNEFGQQMSGDFEGINEIAEMQKENQLDEKELDYIEWEKRKIFQEAYKVLGGKIKEWIRNDSKILDLGCGNGAVCQYVRQNTTGCEILCVDSDKDSLENVKAKQNQKIQVKTFEDDANHFMSAYPDKVDFLTCNASLHEMNDPENQEKYLDNFFDHVKKVLKKPFGTAIIGDYYFPENVSDEDVEWYKDHQFRLVGHADDRNKFIDPELIKQKAIENGFLILDEEDIRTIPEVDRRYQILILGI